jgi:hypothetical protein
LKVLQEKLNAQQKYSNLNVMASHVLILTLVDKHFIEVCCIVAGNFKHGGHWWTSPATSSRTCPVIGCLGLCAPYLEVTAAGTRDYSEDSS